MRIINVHNVNQGLSEGLRHIRYFGVEETSRNGPVWVSPDPVVTVYKNPTARVVFSPLRDANPFFHLMEALWMLQGRNDIEFVARFNKRMVEYSDDGVTQHGAYGHRWRVHFGRDQIWEVIHELRARHDSRRAVLAMWDPKAEWAMGADGKDLPCNTHIYFNIARGALHMTVCCRSNDLWWGCYGANAVHFSVLQEYVAAALGVVVGQYRQLSNNFHIYPAALPQVCSDIKDTFLALCDDARDKDLYTAPFTTNSESVRAHFSRENWSASAPPRIPLVTAIADKPASIEAFNSDLATFMAANYDDIHDVLWREPFFKFVAAPMHTTWGSYKAKDYHLAEASALSIAGDWGVACRQWLERRRQKRNAKVSETTDRAAHG